MPDTEQFQASPEQEEQTKLDEARQKIAEQDDLVPQPSPSNVSGPAHDPNLPADFHDRSGATPAAGEQTVPVTAPEPETLTPETIEPAVATPPVTQRDEDTGRVLTESEQEPSEHQKRVQAGKKAAATRKRNEAKARAAKKAKK